MRSHERATAAALALAFLSACSGGATGIPLPRRVSTEEVLALTRDSEARLILVNVWATWCPPCREELPALARLHEEMAAQGVRVVLVSADEESVALETIARQLGEAGITFQTYVRADDVQALKAGITPDWTGGIPATFLYGPDGELRDFWEGKATYEAFQEKVAAAMSPDGPA